MEENRKAARFVICVPLHVGATKDGLPEFHTGQLRDISRTGILFHSQISFEPGTNLELTFCLPPEKERATCVLVRASSKALRVGRCPVHRRCSTELPWSSNRLTFFDPMLRAAHKCALLGAWILSDYKLARSGL